ncbi:MAG: alpha/beta hydrolase [Haliea sp.]|uniref:alpha/beta hydrolase n=1 Tax=Haliea sp. TaxID=1932666 RepID=UPI0032EE27C0
MKSVLVAFVAVASITVAGCGVVLGQKQAPAAVSTLVYTPADWPEPLQADVYQPQGKGPFPGMLLVHGGGWERRSRDDMDRLARYYVGQGYVVMNVSYRFAPEARYPAQVHDLQQAMHWLHREAGRLGLDAERIGAFGYSAGAHLVSLMALAAGTGNDLDQPWGGERTRPAAVVAGGAPMDLRKYTGGKLVPQFLGGGINEIPETFAAASPVTRVHPDAPPFLLFHGTRDSLVTIDHAEEFVAALAAQNVPVALERQGGRGHILTFLTVGTALPEADAFLQRHLAAVD